MKNFKHFIMLMMVISISVALVGCGVSKEEHDKTVSDLNKAKSELAQANAKKQGKRFDAARTTRWFRAKDLNHDGLLDEIEQKTKAPVGWNTIK